MNAILPEPLMERTLADLPVGESVWIVPWAMWADSRRRCWLTVSHVGCVRENGTADTLVTRTEDGWVVDVTRSAHRWRPGGSTANDSPNDEPVVRIVGEPL